MEIFLSGLFEQTDVYLLIVVRLVGLFVVMPVFGGTNIPNMTKMGLCVMIAGIILSTQSVGPIVYDNNVVGYFILIFKELIVGLIMGYCVYIIFATLYLAGQLIDFEVGFSMVSIFDPATQLQVPITGNIYYFLVSAILVVTNGYHTIFRALFYSYKVLPIGGSNILSSQVMDGLMKMMASYFVIATKIALPVIGAMLVINAALGLMTKTAPQVNIFSVGIPLKMIVGLLIILFTLNMFTPVSDYLFQEIYKNLLNIIEGMMP